MTNPTPPLDEPWAVLWPESHHVQRCYATKAEAEEYCADLNRASTTPDWIVLNIPSLYADVCDLNDPRETPAPTPTRAAVEALPRYRMTVDGLKRWELVSGSSEAVWIDRNDVLALFDAPPRGEAVPRPVNFCSTCGKDVRGLRDVDGIHTCHNPRDAR